MQICCKPANFEAVSLSVTLRGDTLRRRKAVNLRRVRLGCEGVSLRGVRLGCEGVRLKTYEV